MKGKGTGKTAFVRVVNPPEVLGDRELIGVDYLSAQALVDSRHDFDKVLVHS